MFGLIERVIIPSLVIFLLLGGVSGVLLGGALVWRSDAALRFVARMDRWYSSPRLRAAEETMHTPLEPRVEAHPRAAGWIIAAASLLVALGMVVLIIARLR